MARNLLAAFALTLQACTLTSLPTQPSGELGKASSLAAMEAQMDTPGPIEVQTVVSADWQVPLAGLVNLSDERARQARLQDGPEPIQIFAHVLRHPRFGVYLVDTGVSRKLLDEPSRHGLNWLVLRFLPLEKIRLVQSTEQIVRQLPAPLRGVFLTHMHVDHISGAPDIDPAVPFYAGFGEAGSRSLQNLAVQGVTDGVLAGRSAIRQWPAPESGEPLASVLDVFGDGSFYALSVPGHTRGSTAYLARTAQGPVLFVGDTSHTRWGWDNGVEPGSYTEDQPANRRSLLALKALVSRHPGTRIRLGHQAFP